MVFVHDASCNSLPNRTILHAYISKYICIIWLDKCKTTTGRANPEPGGGERKNEVVQKVVKNEWFLVRW